MHCVPFHIFGPNDRVQAITQLVIDFIKERLPIGIRGGYDFVDVRDVAKGVVASRKRSKVKATSSQTGMLP